MKKPINKRIIEALQNNDGIIVNAAQEIGCNRMSLKKWIDEDPELTIEYKSVKEALKDKVEYQLLKNIKEGKETSLIWFMKTQMADRQYIETPANQLNLNVEQLKINYVVPDTPALNNAPEDNIIKININNENTEDNK